MFWPIWLPAPLWITSGRETMPGVLPLNRAVETPDRPAARPPNCRISVFFYFTQDQSGGIQVRSFWEDRLAVGAVVCVVRAWACGVVKELLPNAGT